MTIARKLIDYYKPHGPYHRLVYYSHFGFWLRSLTSSKRIAFQMAVYCALGVVLVAGLWALMP